MHTLVSNIDFICFFVHCLNFPCLNHLVRCSFWFNLGIWRFRRNPLVSLQCKSLDLNCESPLWMTTHCHTPACFLSEARSSMNLGEAISQGTAPNSKANDMNWSSITSELQSSPKQLWEIAMETWLKACWIAAIVLTFLVWTVWPVVRFLVLFMAFYPGDCKPLNSKKFTFII